MDKLNIILNGNLVEGINGETILQLAKRYNIEIPTLCNDERLEPFSSCYLCVVEVDGMKGLQPSCSTKIREGMKIHTDNEKVTQSRKTALDLLLSNHYADCAAPCKLRCPAGVDVQGYIAMINKGLYKEAVEIIKKTNPLPAICGRVCVRPCEVACRRNLVEGVGVGIDYLKRFAADFDLESENKFVPILNPKTGKKVAVIGAGPGGLTSAYYLALDGHDVEIFEANPAAGGMLRYGIPPYRLPNDIIDKEVENITDLGPRIHFNKKLGENLNYIDIKKNFDAAILTIGSQSGTSIGCENDDAGNVLSGIDFLRNMELTGNHIDFSGKTVAIIGGGNTAMDCCRTSLRCGAKKVYVIYRRTEKEMPANPIEIHESKLEGVEYMFLTAPARVNTDESGNLKTLTCLRMKLGEPDSSGRRRPVKIDGSEFEIELDYILAAIGQKTVVNFINDINSVSENKLELTKWGDIQADKRTLQTSIKNIFAAGDGVTGPATLIEAIAQGRKAAKSCHQYLMNQQIVGEEFEFLSKKDNFKKQTVEEYKISYLNQKREEMPTLDPTARSNFYEVELGYNEKTAYNETLRCLECGCTEYYTCDLKKYSTKYKAEQNRFGWDFKQYNVDFSHPYIEIDNNKCILCSRCIRICKEVVDANALGLVNRGFDTFVAPSMRDSLLHTDCESCGLCITTCPTGAITENVQFKPGPFELDKFDSICNYCSVGCEITYQHKNGFFVKVSGKNGLINKDSNLCSSGKFGYKYLNNKERLVKPLKKDGNSFKEIEFEEAFKIIEEKIKNHKSNETAIFAGARLTNEDIYSLKKLAKDGLKTENIFSFQYLDRGDGYARNTDSNVSFEQLKGASKYYLLGSEINKENPVVGYMINNGRFINKTPLILISDKIDSSMRKKADKIYQVKSYYYFIKAVNYYLLKNNIQNTFYLKDNCEQFDEYREKILMEDYSDLILKSGLDQKTIEEFAIDYNLEINAILLYSEKHISSNASDEIKNLAMITGKHGKTSNGIIVLKESCNSEGILNLIPNPQPDTLNKLINGNYKNILIFGEDPLGCIINKELKEKILASKYFMVVQDYFLTETALEADIILPASFPFENGGSYTNTQRNIQHFSKELTYKIELQSFEQITALSKIFGVQINSSTPDELLTEAISTLNSIQENKHMFHYTKSDNYNRIFDYGCDNLVKRFSEEFVKNHVNAKKLFQENLVPVLE